VSSRNFSEESCEQGNRAVGSGSATQPRGDALTRKGPLIVASLILAFASSPGAHAESLPGLFDSDAMGDTYDIRVHVPASYDLEPDRSYPLVVALDANYWFDESSSLSNGFQVAPGGLVEVTDALVAAGMVPEVILVGVGYPGELQRWRDFHGSPNLFFAFLRSELLPALEAQYRIRDEDAVLFGHSSGAAFAAYAFLTAAIYGVDFFEHVLAVSGDYSRTENAIPELESALARRAEADRVTPAGSLYLAYGGAEEARFQLSARDLHAGIESREYEQVRLRLTEYIGHDHGSVVLPAFREGLRWTLGDLSGGFNG
jgi:predicted alpha/beta superfamily hydrolase